MITYTRWLYLFRCRFDPSLLPPPLIQHWKITINKLNVLQFDSFLSEKLTIKSNNKYRDNNYIVKNNNLYSTEFEKKNQSWIAFL